MPARHARRYTHIPCVRLPLTSTHPPPSATFLQVLIFSQFKIMLDVLEDYLHLCGHPCERIDGSTSSRDRQAAIDRYSKGGCWLGGSVGGWWIWVGGVEGRIHLLLIPSVAIVLAPRDPRPGRLLAHAPRPPCVRSTTSSIDLKCFIPRPNTVLQRAARALCSCCPPEQAARASP